MNPFDKNGVFHASVGRGDLKGVAVRGAGVTIVSQAAGFVIQVVATIALARLLTPADFGVLTMVTTFSLLLTNFGVNGFTEAIVQRDRMDHGLASNIFWINVGLGLLLTAGFAGAGSLLARLYRSQTVASVTIAMSATIFLTSVSVVHLALLRRALQFSTVSMNELAARALSVAVSILLAWRGWRYWALVIGAIALPLSTSIGAWARCRWIPGAPKRAVGTRYMVKFAMNTYGYFAANYCTRNLDNLLVGWFFGPQALGLYKKAYDLCVLPVAQLAIPLHAVAVPTLSRLVGDSEKYHRYVLRSLSTLALVGMGIGAVLALVGRDLIFLLLGPRWSESGRIFTYFGPGIGIVLLYYTHGWITVSIGRPDRWFVWGVIELVVTAVCFLVGIRWGPVGIATAWVVSTTVLTIPGLWFSGSPVGLGIRSIIGAIWKYVIAAALAGSLTAFSVDAVIPTLATETVAGAIERIFVLSGVFALAYTGFVIILHGACRPLYEAIELAGDMLPRRSSSVSSTSV